MKSFNKTEKSKDKKEDKEMNVINTSMNNIKTDDTKSIERNLSDVNISIITEPNFSPVIQKKTSDAIFLNTSYTNKEKKQKRQEKCLKKIILFLVIFAMCSLLYLIERKFTLKSR